MKTNSRIIILDNLQQAKGELASLTRAKSEIQRLNSTQPDFPPSLLKGAGGIDLIARRSIHRGLKLEGVNDVDANILQHEMRLIGGEAVIGKNVTGNDSDSDIIIMGTLNQFDLLVEKLKIHPNLSMPTSEYRQQFITSIQTALHSFDNPVEWTLECRGRYLTFGKRTLIMGVLNVTPDSFSDGGLYADADIAVKRAQEMVAQGADIIDVGGESSRPGSDPVSIDEELQRVLPVIKRIAQELDVLISIDTYKSTVAAHALKAGAHIVNDISGLNFDPNMAKLAADTGAPVVLMHIQGTPKNMQIAPQYRELISEIILYLRNSIEHAETAGVSPEKIIIDPGIGFGKTMEHNLEIIRRLKEFRCLGKPILIGTSRKSFIGKILDLPAEERIEGTIATVVSSIINGADIVRIHDVKQVQRAVKMVDAIYR
ncbi:dihydropteroate synthase [Candidatus Poribacteria bacterium]|nr:dihydropteroate synthase [Candidatus Poribacteria bacterium]